MGDIGFDAADTDHGSGGVDDREFQSRPDLGSFGRPGGRLAPDRQAGFDHPAIVLLVQSRSEEHTSELQSLMRISYAVFCLKKKITYHPSETHHHIHPGV